MNIFDVITLFGGLAMFLYGMRLMGDGLREGASGTLRKALEKVTNSSVKAFFLGLIMTAIIQSSTATIVITSGLVGAGLLSLHQSLGIIIGANVGTTVTGQIIRLLDLNASGSSILRLFTPSTLAPLALIIGIIIVMSGKKKHQEVTGHIIIGFGILFSGLLNMTGAVSSLSDTGLFDRLFSSLSENPFLGYAIGAGVAFVLQSSSATIGILQAFALSGSLTFGSVYSVIVGIYLGDCVTTAIVCSIGAEADAKRVGLVNILFNLGKTVLVLAVVAVVHRMGLLDGLWDKTVNSGIIANTNSIFNLTCAVCLLPTMGIYEKISRKLIKDDAAPEEKYKDKLDGLNPVFFDTPALALRSCYDLLQTIFSSARTNIEKACLLLNQYDERVHQEILAEEDEIDHMTDRLSRYTVELLPHLQNENHVAILNQYYKVTAEFERLGDHAVNIAENAASLSAHGTTYSVAAHRELAILESAISEILTKSEVAFTHRDVDAAYAIEPLVQVVGEIVTQLKRNHLQRMSSGVCNIYADASFTNLMVEFKRIAAVCSNVGVATVVRSNPELADHEHLYYESLRSGGSETYNTAFELAHDRFFSQLALVNAT